MGGGRGKKENLTLERKKKKRGNKKCEGGWRPVSLSLASYPFFGPAILVLSPLRFPATLPLLRQTTL